MTGPAHSLLLFARRSLFALVVLGLSGAVLALCGGYAPAANAGHTTCRVLTAASEQDRLQCSYAEHSFLRSDAARLGSSLGGSDKARKIKYNKRLAGPALVQLGEPQRSVLFLSHSAAAPSYTPPLFGQKRKFVQHCALLI